MAGYSGTPLPKKLGIKEDHRVAVLGGPDGFEDLQEPLPDGVTIRKAALVPTDMTEDVARARSCSPSG